MKRPPDGRTKGQTWGRTRSKGAAEASGKTIAERMNAQAWLKAEKRSKMQAYAEAEAEERNAAT
eukprot:6205691-Pleurochrysis_carterae.AAC.2